jgi:hypothetical protein
MGNTKCHVTVKQDVLGLEIAMADSIMMHIIEGVNHLPEEIKCFVL